MAYRFQRQPLTADDINYLKSIEENGAAQIQSQADRRTLKHLQDHECVELGGEEIVIEDGRSSVCVAHLTDKGRKVLEEYDSK